MLATSLATFYVLVAAFSVSVSAGLFGTSPVATTVWSAGRSHPVTWTDDKSSPHLKQLGSMDIMLYSGDDTPVATLAQNVNPGSKSQDVWISPAWGHNGSDYYIRFSCKQPQLSIYTAFFTILDMSTMSNALDNQTTAPDELFTPYLTLVLPNATVTSALQPVRTSARPTPTRPPISSDEEDAYLHAQSPQYIAGASPVGHRIDFEKLKFRLVFILWPALIGITMAL